MQSFAEELRKRQEAADAQEAAYVAHFGPEAANCANWQRLWEAGWQERLTNSFPTATYQPKGLPKDADGVLLNCSIGEDNSLYVGPPTIYSRKFYYHFATELIEDRTELLERLTAFLDAPTTSTIDCDQFTTVLDRLANYLSNYTTYYLEGTGDILEAGEYDPERWEVYLQGWRRHHTGTGVFINRAGITHPSGVVVRSDVALRTLQRLQEELEATRQRLKKEGHPVRKFSISQLGLLLFYNRQEVREGKTANAIAAAYGFDSNTSGKALYDDYIKYCKEENRTDYYGDERAGQAMIKRIEAVFPSIELEERQKLAKRDIEHIKSQKKPR